MQSPDSSPGLCTGLSIMPGKTLGSNTDRPEYRLRTRVPQRVLGDLTTTRLPFFLLCQRWMNQITVNS